MTMTGTNCPDRSVVAAPAQYSLLASATCWCVYSQLVAPPASAVLACNGDRCLPSPRQGIGAFLKASGITTVCVNESSESQPGWFMTVNAQMLAQPA
ncbi:hypothetical protein JG687_00000238 [Phytophthora cactorum]|uniref:Uncharacterized protein n=1 Tax=Phytophthora cactorum TaxID=29920 RepID=A0A8T1V435_9STRA|nr:hypothetical protein GQ600_4112 [Phytophthora cactorum]KAG6974649.1 hypothetical protein JG687_00000238 [Phytophthora cactorum]